MIRCGRVIPNQDAVADAGGLEGIIDIVRRHQPPPGAQNVPGGSGGIVRRAADAVTNLAHENPAMKARKRSFRARSGWSLVVAVLGGGGLAHGQGGLLLRAALRRHWGELLRRCSTHRRL
jgi:hypothetical protein